MPKIIKIKFQNGINKQSAEQDILNELKHDFIFEESEHPDFIIFGPYGNDVPIKGDYVRIGYFCENIRPEMSICEWAFGVPNEDEINHPNYRRIQWHGLNPESLIKDLDDNDIDRALNSKNKFCNFLYSHKVPHREEFFRQLSKYKKVDSPGKSMNNMPSIDKIYPGNIWERKRQFLSQYKFTIAFENDCYPGYQTEKLYDAMQCNSIPIYCGDPYIDTIFNRRSFINAADYVQINSKPLISFLEKYTQLNFTDIRPQHFYQPRHRIQRKLKAWGKELKKKWQFNRLDFTQLIERIIEIDQNDKLYIDMLKQSWFTNNVPPDNLSTKKQWELIFNGE